jgi:hypothetical protein
VLEQVMDEAAKTIVAHVTTAGIAGAGKLIALVHRKTRPDADLPRDPEAVAEQLLAWAEADPEWAEQVRAALIGEPVSTIDPPPDPFVDRDELRDVVRALPRSVYLFNGLAGSGKTALTHKIAEDLAQSLLANPCYLDLDLFRANGIIRFGEAMRHALRQLGITELADGEADLAAQYRATLVTSNVLLIIDNLETAVELRTLAPGWSNYLVLATTRSLTTDLELDFTTARVPGLASEDALALLGDRPQLRGMIAAEPDAARALLGWFDNMPLAVKEIGLLLSRRIGEPGAIADLLAQIQATGSTDLARLTAARLAATVDALPAEAAQTFPLLVSIPASDFTRDVAAALFETDDSAALRILDEFRRAELVTELGSARYRLPSYIRERGKAAPGRLIDYYLTTAIAADLAGGARLRRSLIPEPAPTWSMRLGRIDWLDANREALGALVERLYRAGRDEQVCQLCAALEHLVLSRKRYDLCLTAFEYGTAAARRLPGRPALVARMLSLQGRVCALLHLFDRADAQLTEAAQLAAATGDPDLMASIAEFTGLCHQAANDLPQAAAYFAQAVDIDRRTDAQRALGIHARMLANVQVMLGQPREALDQLSGLDEYFAANNDPRNRSRVAAVAAKAYSLFDVRQARSQLDRARQFAEQSGSLAAYREELDDIEAEIAYRAQDYGTARSIWGRLIQEALTAHHPKSATYQAKLNWLPRPE